MLENLIKWDLHAMGPLNSCLPQNMTPFIWIRTLPHFLHPFNDFVLNLNQHHSISLYSSDDWINYEFSCFYCLSLSIIKLYFLPKFDPFWNISQSDFLQGHLATLSSVFLMCLPYLKKIKRCCPICLIFFFFVKVKYFFASLSCFNIKPFRISRVTY